MTPVRCTGCGRRIAYASGDAPQRYKQWCDLACTLDGEVTPVTERTDLWLALHDAGRTDTEIASLYGVDRSLVGRIVRSRRPARFVRRLAAVR